MGLDIRIPIGLLFEILGIILALFGLFGPKDIYMKSLGVNINLWWGLLLLLFGTVMLVLGKRGMAATAMASLSEMHGTEDTHDSLPTDETPRES